VQVTISHIWPVRSTESIAEGILAVIEGTQLVQPVKHKVDSAVDVAHCAQQALAGMRIDHRGTVEDRHPTVGAVLPLEAGAAVLDLLMALVQHWGGKATNHLTAVQVP